MSKQKFSDQELIDALENNLSFKQICEKFECSNTAVALRMKKLGVSTFTYKFDENIFENIDTEEKAYWLGFLYADGYVSDKKHGISISLKLEDIEHLKKFVNFLKHKRGKIHTKTIKLNNKTYYCCVYGIQNQKIYNDLVKHGCFNNKSLILMPPPKNTFKNKELIYPFIRGYIDGDGSIFFNKSGSANLEILGTKEFLEFIKSVFPDFSALLKDKRHKHNTFYIVVCSKKCLNVLDKIYSNATIYLDRKYKRYKLAVLQSNL